MNDNLKFSVIKPIADSDEWKEVVQGYSQEAVVHRLTASEDLPARKP